MSKTESETWKQGTDWKLPEERDERGCGKMGKGLVKEHVWMTHGHGHGQQGGDGL